MARFAVSEDKQLIELEDKYPILWIMAILKHQEGLGDAGDWSVGQ